MLPRSCLRQGLRSAAPTPLELGIDGTLSGPQGFRGPVSLCEMAARAARFVRPLPKVFNFSARIFERIRAATNGLVDTSFGRFRKQLICISR